MTAAMKPASPASRRPRSPLRPCRPRVPTQKPRRARRPASASGSATTCGPSAPRWSRRISRRISGPPSTSCCSRWAARYSPPATTTHALDIAVRETPDRPPLRANDDAFAAMSPGEAMLADRSSLPFDWLTMEDDGEAFAALRALPEAGQAEPVHGLHRAHGEGPARLRARRPARAGGDRRPPRHRLRRPCPAQRRDVLVAPAQGPDARHRPRHARRGMGVRPPQGQEGHSGGGDGKRLRRRRCARGRDGRGARRRLGLGAARLPCLRPGPHRRRRGRHRRSGPGAGGPARNRYAGGDRGGPSEQHRRCRVRRHPVAGRRSRPGRRAPAHLRGREHRLAGRRRAPGPRPRQAGRGRCAQRRSDRRRRPQGHRPDGGPRRRRERRSVAGRRSAHAAGRGNGHDSDGLEIPAFLRRG